MNVNLDAVRKTFEDRAPQPIGKHRFFSVLVPIVEKDGELSLLFEVRSKNLKADPGEVCFPGGHVEEGEDPGKAALRETFEEIGIPEEAVEMIGPGDILYGYANYTLYTYMGVVKYEDYLNARLAYDEVEEIFLVPLKKFRENQPEIYSEKTYAQVHEDFPHEKVGIDKAYSWRTGIWHIPIYDIDGRIIWGLTARITQNLVDVLWSGGETE